MKFSHLKSERELGSGYVDINKRTLAPSPLPTLKKKKKKQKDIDVVCRLMCPEGGVAGRRASLRRRLAIKGDICLLSLSLFSLCLPFYSWLPFIFLLLHTTLNCKLCQGTKTKDSRNFMYSHCCCQNIFRAAALLQHFRWEREGEIYTEKERGTASEITLT